MASRRLAAARLLGLSSTARPWDTTVAGPAQPDQPAQQVRPGRPAGPDARMFGALHREVATALQVPRLIAGSPRLARAPKAPRPGHVVVDVPGWRAPEVATLPLRTYLRWLGYDARAWGFGTNRGDARADARRLAERVVELADEHGPVSLVGWSLGGVIVREVARSHPASVACVITYGSPVFGGRVPARVPVTALVSRRDGIVPWRSAIDRRSPGIEHVEVDSTHLGLGFDPDVWEVVAARLARAAGPDRS